MKNVKEEWKEIDGYSGRYYISNIGRVWSVKYNKIMSIMLTPNYSGYPWIRLINSEGEGKSWFLHRLVALHFVPNDDPENKTILNHIDEDKLNPRWDNLEWCNNSYNVTYGTRTERYVATRKGMKYDEVWRTNIGNGHKKPIRVNGIEYDGLIDATKALGLKRSRLDKYLYRKKFDDFIWQCEYIEKENGNVA